VIFREAAPVLPLVAFAMARLAGADPTDAGVLVPFLLTEAAGVFLYVQEIRYRFRKRGGRR